MTGRAPSLAGHPTRPPQRENFPVALRVLPAAPRTMLLATYRYARYVDDLGDQGPVGGRTERLEAVSEAVGRLYAGQPAADAVVEGMRHVVETTGVPQHCLLRLVEANLTDQHVSRYQTFEDLLDYCRLSANPVGEMVLHIFAAATPERVELSDRICTALQLLEHWQDLREDHQAGRVYLPKADLRRFGVDEDALSMARATPGLRRLVAFETERAACWLGAGAPLVSTLRGPARLAVSAYVAGGRAATELLRRSGYDPLGADDLKPTGRAVARAWVAAAVRSAG